MERWFWRLESRLSVGTGAWWPPALPVWLPPPEGLWRPISGDRWGGPAETSHGGNSAWRLASTPAPHPLRLHFFTLSQNKLGGPHKENWKKCPEKDFPTEYTGNLNNMDNFTSALVLSLGNFALKLDFIHLKITPFWGQGLA